MRKTLKMLAAALLLAMLCGCTQQPAAEPPELLEPVGVEADITKAYIGEICTMECYNASVEAYTEGVYFETEGNVSAVYAYPGKWVEKDEILVELNQSSLTERRQTLEEEIAHIEKISAYEDAVAELQIEMLQVELRQMQVARADSAQIALKKNEISTAQAALRQTQQLRQPELKQKKEELEQIEKQLGQNVLRAPFSGRVVSMRQMNSQTRVQAYEPVVFIADESRLSLSGDFVADSVLAGARKLYARIGEHEYEIKAQPMEQQEQVRLSLLGSTMTTGYLFSEETDISGVQAGDYALICVVNDLEDNALLLPAGAVLQDESGYYVYAEEDGQRVRRVVSIGVRNDALVQIVEGIEEGAVVYVED